MGAEGPLIAVQHLSAVIPRPGARSPSPKVDPRQAGLVLARRDRVVNVRHLVGRGVLIATKRAAGAPAVVRAGPVGGDARAAPTEGGKLWVMSGKRPPPRRVFLSHTSELRQFPTSGIVRGGGGVGGGAGGRRGHGHEVFRCSG